MGGVGVKLNIDNEAIRRMLAGVIKRMSNTLPAMKIIGEIVRTSVVRNFEKGGRPDKWKALSPATLRTKKGTAILREQGMAGGLMGSINHKAFDDKAIVSANKVYAAIHHFGGKAGRGRKVTIPERPFMLVQNEDWPEMLASLNDYVVRGK